MDNSAIGRERRGRKGKGGELGRWEGKGGDWGDGREGGGMGRGGGEQRELVPRVQPINDRIDSRDLSMEKYFLKNGKTSTQDCVLQLLHA